MYNTSSVSVEFLRQTQMRRFLNDCRESLDKTAPEARTNFNGEEIRGKFLGKLSDGELASENRAGLLLFYFLVALVVFFVVSPFLRK